MAFYADSYDRPNKSAIASEDVDVGTGVVINSSGKAELFTAETHSAEDFAGVADFPRTSDAISEDDEDTSYGTYVASENDRVVIAGGEDESVIRLKTAEDSGSDTTPDTTGSGTVVGFPDYSNGDAPDGEGRIVEEGYTNTTTFERGNNNFVAIGKVYANDGASGFDEVVKVEVDKSL